jgi:hypothetical protein
MNAKYMRHKDYKHGHIYRSTECLSWIGSLSIVPIDCMWDTYPLFKRQCNTDTTMFLKLRDMMQLCIHKASCQSVILLEQSKRYPTYNHNTFEQEIVLIACNVQGKNFLAYKVSENDKVNLPMQELCVHYKANSVRCVSPVYLVTGLKFQRVDHSTLKILDMYLMTT